MGEGVLRIGRTKGILSLNVRVRKEKAKPCESEERGYGTAAAVSLKLEGCMDR